MDLHSASAANLGSALPTSLPTSLQNAISESVFADGHDIQVVDSEAGALKNAAQDAAEKFPISESEASLQSVDGSLVPSVQIETSASKEMPIAAPPAADNAKKPAIGPDDRTLQVLELVMQQQLIQPLCNVEAELKSLDEKVKTVSFLPDDIRAKMKAVMTEVQKPITKLRTDYLPAPGKMNRGNVEYFEKSEDSDDRITSAREAIILLTKAIEDFQSAADSRTEAEKQKFERGAIRKISEAKAMLLPRLAKEYYKLAKHYRFQQEIKIPNCRLYIYHLYDDAGKYVQKKELETNLEAAEQYELASKACVCAATFIIENESARGFSGSTSYTIFNYSGNAAKVREKAAQSIAQAHREIADKHIADAKLYERKAELKMKSISVDFGYSSAEKYIERASTHRDRSNSSSWGNERDRARRKADLCETAAQKYEAAGDLKTKQLKATSFGAALWLGIRAHLALISASWFAFKNGLDN